MADSPKHAGQFDRELNYRAVFWFMVGIAVITAGTFVGVWFGGEDLKQLLAGGDPQPTPAMQVAERPLPPGPLLQTEPYADMDAMRADHDAVLHSYSLIDAERGTVRIPVAEAMDRIVENGLPTWTAPAPPSPATPISGEGDR